MDGDGWMSLSMRSPSSECFQLDERGTQRKQYALEVATREIEIAIAWKDNVTRPGLCRDRAATCAHCRSFYAKRSLYLIHKNLGNELWRLEGTNLRSRALSLRATIGGRSCLDPSFT